MKRFIAILTIASGIVCSLSLVLFFVSFNLTLANWDAEHGLTSHHSVAVTSHCRCGVSDGSVWFFSHDYPCTENLRFLSDDNGGVFYNGGGHARATCDWKWTAGGCRVAQATYIGDQDEVVGRDVYADFPGIYYRHFAGLNETRPIWTLRVSLWYPILIFAILPALWLRRDRSRLLLLLLLRKMVDLVSKSRYHQGRSNRSP